MEATNQPFDIPELLEAVLSHLPIRDLLLAQRVCRQWQDSITTSPLLQQRLFFKSMPGSITEGFQDDGKNQQQWETNPLLASILPTVQIPGTEVVDSFIAPPWMCSEEEQDELLRKAIMRPDSSWRRMYPVQPAARICKVFLNGWCCGAGEREDVFIGKNYEYMQYHGATMGFVYDVCIMLLDTNCNNGSFDDWGMCLVEGKGLEVYLNYMTECYGGGAKETGLKIMDLDENVVTEYEDNSREFEQRSHQIDIYMTRLDV